MNALSNKGVIDQQGSTTLVGSYTYLTIEQLAERINFDVSTIRTRLRDKHLLEGVHYVRPFGGRKMLFLWEAIERDMIGPVAWESRPVKTGGAGAADVSAVAESLDERALEVLRGDVNGAAPAGSLSPDRTRWTPEELELLCETLGNRSAIEKLAEKLDRTPRSLTERYARIAREGIDSARPNGRGPLRSWTVQELAWLRENYASSSSEQLKARFPHRRLLAVRCRASEMGLTLSRSDAARIARTRAAEGSSGPRAGMPESEVPATAALVDPLTNFSPTLSGLKQWSLAELQLVQQLCARGISDQEIQERLSKRRQDLRAAKMYLGISPNRAGRWTALQEQRLVRSFSLGGLQQCVADTENVRRPQEVRNRLIYLGLLPGRQVVWHPWERRYLLQAIALHYRIDEIAYSLTLSRDLVVARARSMQCAERDIEACVLRGKPS